MATVNKKEVLKLCPEDQKKIYKERGGTEFQIRGTLSGNPDAQGK